MPWLNRRWGSAGPQTIPTKSLFHSIPPGQILPSVSFPYHFMSLMIRTGKKRPSDSINTKKGEVFTKTQGSTPPIKNTPSNITLHDEASSASSVKITRGGKISVHFDKG